MGAPATAAGQMARRWIAPTCLVLFVLLFFHPVVRGQGLLYFRDICLNHYPTRLYVTPLLRSGDLPLWNPYLSGGMPLAANPNNLIFHPITLLFLFLPVSVAFHASVLLQYLLAAWGLLRWGREAGIGEEASLFGALVFTLSGGMASCGTFHNLLSSWAWVPVALFAFTRHRNTGGRGALLGFAGSLGVQLVAGDPIAAGTTMFLALVETIGGRRRGQEGSMLRDLGSVGLGAAAGFGLALIQILPAREMLAVSGRASGIPYPDAAIWSVSPARLLEGILPSLYGDPTALKPTSYWGGLVFERGYPFLLTLYFGAVPLILALAALGRRRDPRVLALSGAATLSVLTALGSAGGIYPLLYRHVPLVASLRYPSRFLLPAFLFLSCLAALGLDRVLEEARREKSGAAHRILWGGSLLLAVGGVGAGLSQALPLALARHGLGIPGSAGEVTMAAAAASLRGSFLRCGLLAAGLFALSMAVRGGAVRRSLLPVLVILAAAGDLVAANSRVNPVAPRGFYDARPPVLEILKEEDSWTRVYPDPRPQNLAVWASSDSAIWGYRWDQLSLRVSTALPYRIRLAYDPSTDLLSPRAVNDLSARTKDLDAPRLRRLCDLASVGTLMTYRELADPSLVPAGVITRRTSIPFRFYRNPDPLPEAYLVSRARPHHGAALEALTDPAFDPRAEVYLEGITEPVGTPGGGGSVRFLERTPERIRLSVSARRRGWLVFTENYYPGWVADLDGRRVGIQRGNYLFRAVAMPAGSHVLTFSYRPSSLAWGALGTLATLLGAGTWVLRGSRRRF